MGRRLRECSLPGNMSEPPCDIQFGGSFAITSAVCLGEPSVRIEPTELQLCKFGLGRLNHMLIECSKQFLRVATRLGAPSGWSVVGLSVFRVSYGFGPD